MSKKRITKRKPKKAQVKSNVPRTDPIIEKNKACEQEINYSPKITPKIHDNYNFVIKNVKWDDIVTDIGNVNDDFDILPSQEIEIFDKTDFQDLSPNKVNETENSTFASPFHGKIKIKKKPILFVDAKKSTVELWPIMWDVTSEGLLPEQTTRPCRKCKFQFQTRALGCPLNYSSESHCFFTEHIFCSFPCIKAYILSCLSVEPTSCKYGNSLNYLSMMYKISYNIKTSKHIIIDPAPSLDFLEIYGGHLQISEYRSLLYSNTKYKKAIPSGRLNMSSISAYMIKS